MKRYITLSTLLILFGTFTQSCLTLSQDTIPVDWGENSAERIYSQVISIMNQNILLCHSYIYIGKVVHREILGLNYPNNYTKFEPQ